MRQKQTSQQHKQTSTAPRLPISPPTALNMSNTAPRLPIARSNDHHGSSPANSSAGSIRAILLKNCTTRLFVHPLERTADHLEALDVDLVIPASTGELVVDDIKRQVDESTQLLGAGDIEGSTDTTTCQKHRLCSRIATTGCHGERLVSRI